MFQAARSAVGSAKPMAQSTSAQSRLVVSAYLSGVGQRMKAFCQTTHAGCGLSLENSQVHHHYIFWRFRLRRDLRPPSFASALAGGLKSSRSSYELHQLIRKLQFVNQSQVATAFRDRPMINQLITVWSRGLGLDAHHPLGVHRCAADPSPHLDPLCRFRTRKSPVNQLAPACSNAWAAR
jgi:hypothetical protein